MKAPFVAAVALVAFTLAGVAQAGPGPTSPLYLTTYSNGPGTSITVVQGNSVIQTFPAAYSSEVVEMPIAVYGDIRTTGFCSQCGVQYTVGGQYTLGGTPTGKTYAIPSSVTWAEDSTSDGSHNYLVDFHTGTVYQTARDFTNPVALFVAASTNDALGITYDPLNSSLWISDNSDSTVYNYSLSGTLLSSFSTGHNGNVALALDPADHTLWLTNDTGSNPVDLEQYSTAGVLLSTGPYVDIAFGAEFDLAPTTPEPGTLILFGSGILGLAGVLRRKINL